MKKLQINHLFKKMSVVFLALTMLISLLQWGSLNQIHATDEAVANITFDTQIVGSIGDSTSTLSNIETGAPFFLALRYSVLSGGDGVNYKSCLISITLPDSIDFDELAMPEGTESVFNTAKVETFGKFRVLRIGSGDTLEAGNAGTVYLKMHFKNMETADGTTAIFEDMEMTGTEQSATASTPLKAISIPSAKITALAHQEWTIEKSIEKQDDQNTSITDINGHKYYKVNYQILIRPGAEDISANRYGRLNCDSFVLTDILPTNYPTGGAAQLSEIKVGNKTLVENKDYVIKKNKNNDIESIQLNYVNTYNGSDSQSLIPQGAAINTTYSMTLLYDYDAYKIRQNEEFEQKTLTNAATLTYKPLGKAQQTVSSSIPVSLGWQETDQVHVDFKVTKKATVQTTGTPEIGVDDTFVFDKTMQDVYYRDSDDHIQFGLYTDEKCTILAKDNNKQIVNPIAIDEKGQVSFQAIPYGTYYLKEISNLNLFKNAGVKKIVIDENDGSITVNDQKITDGNIDFINTTDENGYGYVAFWKRGSSATSKDTGWLAGVQFTLTNGHQTYDATSDQNGLVLFAGIPAGNYTVQEKQTNDGEFEVSQKTWSVTVKGNQVNYPQGMDVYSEKGITYPYVQNVSYKGKFKIIKKSSVDNENLSGAIFEIYVPDNLNKTWTEDELKNFNTAHLTKYTLDCKDQSSVESPALKPGTYIYREVKAPTGYVLDSEFKTVVVKQNELVEVIIQNIPQGRLEVKKFGILSTDLPFKIAIDGSEFEIYTNKDLKAEHLVKDNDGHPVVIKPYKTYDDRIATSNIVYLDEGTYYLKETKAPDGYQKNTIPIELDVINGQLTSIEVDNQAYQQGLVSLVKTDKKTGQGLQGAQFDIKNSQGKVVDTITTDSHGSAQSKLLPSGTYTLVEKTAPSGYIKLEKHVSFTITDNQKTIISNDKIANTPYMKYQFKKVDSITSNAIEGVKFRLYETDPTNHPTVAYIGEYTSDNQGIVTFDHLVDGKTYYFVEVSTNENYTLDQTVHSFTASLSNAAEVSNHWVQTGSNITNVPKGKFTVHKTVTDLDSTHQSDLSGMNFSYYPKITNNYTQDKATANDNGTYMSLGTTNQQGLVTSQLLDAGEYWVEEEANNDYNPIEPKVVTVKAGITINSNADNGLLEINNTFAKGKLKMRKISSINSQGIDVTFSVYKKVDQLTDYSNQQELYTVRTNSPIGEKLSTHWFEPGEYVLVEKTIHSGSYVLDKTPHPFTIEAGKTNTQYYDQPIVNIPTSSLSLIKYESWNTVGQNEVNFVSTGFVFKIYTAIPCLETDEGSIQLNGQYYKKDKDTKKTLTSSDQTVSVTGLKPGVYIVEENLTDQQKNDGFTQAPSQAVELEAGKTASVTFKNKNSNSKMKITKVDAEDHNLLLDDAVFEIYREAKPQELGEEITIGEQTYHVVSANLGYTVKSGTGVVYDQNGKPITQTGVGYSGFLEPGVTYFLKEITPPHDYLASQLWTKVGPLEGGKLSEVTIENFKPIEAVGDKVDGLGNKVAGATFALFSSRDKAHAAAKLTDDKLTQLATDTTLQKQYGVLQVMTTGGNGQIQFKNLDVTQTYYVLEIKAPVDNNNNPAYKRDTAVHEVFIKVDGQRYYLIDKKTNKTLSVVNYLYQKIWIKKQLEFAGETKELNGVNFKVYQAVSPDATHQTVIQHNGHSYALGNLVDTLHTGTDTPAGNGGAVSIGLPAGKYIVVEEDDQSLPDHGLVVNENNRYHLVELTHIDSNNREDNKVLYDHPIINTTSYGSFYLNKVSNVQNTKLKATFILQIKQNGSYVDYKVDGKTFTIQTNGQDIFKFYEKFHVLLKPGYYQLVEKSVEEGYTMGQPIQFDIQAGKITGMNGQNIEHYDSAYEALIHPLVVVNNAQGSIELKKYGRQIGDSGSLADVPLPNVRFEIYKWKKVGNKLELTETIGTGLSQADGKIVFYNSNGADVTDKNWLDAGDYVIKETDVGANASSGYQPGYLGKFTISSHQKTTQVTEININGNEISSASDIIVNQSQYGQFSIKKVDFYNHSKTLAGIAFDVYTKSGSTYTKVKDVTMVTNNQGIATSPLLPEGDYYLKETQTLDGYVLDNQYFGPYTVTKQSVNEVSTPITNVMKQSILIEKIDSDLKQVISDLTGTTFALYANKTDQKPLQTVTYHKNTGIIFNDLKADTIYYLKEVKAPAGYELKSDWIEVKTGQSQNDSTKPVVMTKEIENDRLGSLKIEKVAQWDMPGSLSQKLPLANAEFTLYKADEKTIVQKGSTDKNGVITFIGLVAGNYVLKETKTIDGFESNHQSYSVTIVKGQENTVYTGSNAIVNNPRLGKFEFKKVDAKHQALTGAKFKLVKIEGTNEKVIFDQFTTESDGTFSSRMLDPGDYRLEEIEAPKGYTKIQPITFEIIARQITRLGTNGNIVDDAQGSITITKYNDVGQYLSGQNNEPLAGVHFGLYSSNNQLISEKITDAAGKIVWENIDPGDYYVKEMNTEDNPKGYQYSATQYSVTVESGKAQLVNYYPQGTTDGKIINQSIKGKVVIHKKDAHDSNLTSELAGAVFGVFKDSTYTENVDEVIIGSDGYGISQLLPADKNGTTYYIKELKAPDGYVLDDSISKITGEVKVYPIQNEKLIKILADTDKNYIEFENTSLKDLMSFKTEIQKGITTSMKQSVTSENSLSEKPYETVFALRGYAEGNNTVPAKYLEVSDIKTTMKYYDASRGQYVEDDKVDGDSWIIHSVSIYRAYNQVKRDQITAKVYYQSYDNGQLSDWKAVPYGEIANVQNIGTTSSLSISLSPQLKAKHVKVRYEGVGIGFKAKGIDIKYTFNQRQSLEDYHEIRLIENIADIDYQFIVKDRNGNDVLQSVKPESNKVEIHFPTLESKMPTVNIGVMPSHPSGASKTTFKPGDTVQYDITVKNVSNNHETFNSPIISFDMPIGMSLNDSFNGIKKQRYQLLHTDAQGNTSTIEMSDLNITYTPVANARIVDQNGSLVETDAPTTKVTVKFRNPKFKLEAGESLRLTLAGTIAANESRTSLWMPTYLNSEEKKIKSVENPYGNSFSVNVPEDIDNPLVEDKVLDGVIQEEVTGGNKYANANANITVNENNTLMIQKYVKGDYDSQYLNYNQIGSTSPGGNIDYLIDVKNGVDSDSAVNKIRVVDLLPFKGDSYVGRDNEAGMLTERVTELERDAILKNVNVSSLPTGANYKIYYCVDGTTQETKWAKWLNNNSSGRVKVSKKEELPMLYDSMSDQVWDNAINYHYWIDATDKNTFEQDLLPYVSAVAVEITCHNNHYLEKGESVQIQIEMNAPMYTTSESDQFTDKLIANSAMVAVGRVGHQDNILNSDRTENHEVKVQLSMPRGSIGDYAFYDINRNGLQDESDAPIAGLKVKLHEFKHYYDNGNVKTIETLYETNTDNSGYYHFDDLACNVPLNNVETGSDKPSDYVGNVLYEYYVEFDRPADESRYQYEPTIRYAEDENGQPAIERDSNIDSHFKTATIRLTAKRGNDGLTYIGEDNPTLDAGFSALGALGDYVWFDANRNGIQDTDEPGINGVTVHLYAVDSDGTTYQKIKTTTTSKVYGQDGYYLFEELEEGKYVVEFDVTDVSPEIGGYTEHYSFTTANQGDDEFDSDASVKVSETVMRTGVITLDARGYDMTNDAGLTVYSAITGIAFEDRNYSDIQDLDGKTDVYIPGTIVELYEISSEDGTRSVHPIATQTVKEDGRYYFDHLVEGSYQVKFIFPKDYEIINGNIGNDDTIDSDIEYDISEELNSGYTEVVTIPQNRLVEHVDGGASRFSALGDYVWFDANKNGLQDKNQEEYGIENVPVYLQMRSLNTNGWEQIAEAMTDTNGYYRFNHLKSSEYGTGIEYRVIFDLPFPSKLTIPKNGDQALDSNALSVYVPGAGYPTDHIYLQYNTVDLTWDAGITNSLGSVGDYVWFDENKNGIQDEINKGLEGIAVILEYNESGDVGLEDNWTVVETTTTNASGYYIFNDLVAGMYRVRFEIDKPYYVTLSHMGNDNQIDSDGVLEFDENWYYTRPFYLEEEGYDMTWDCGVYLPEKEDTILNIIPGFPLTSDSTFVYGYLALACLSTSALTAIYLHQRKKKRTHKHS